MTKFKGFVTKEEALRYKKENGGMLCTKYKKNGAKHPTYTDYMFAVKFGGLDENKYPYCLQWGGV